MKIRRVATGHDDHGKAVFASDELIEPLTVGALPGAEFHRLWGGDETPTFPDDGSPPAQPMFFPPVGGYRFAFFSVAPAGVEPPANLDPETSAAAIEAALPGMTSYMETDDPGMHTTDTIDFEVVISGEVVLELDDGAEKTLRPGDTIVQNGTRHRWLNRGTEPAVLAVFIVGAHRR
jgi:mannose-6-phosphate isomerase-like protein (cupin superfamily)